MEKATKNQPTNEEEEDYMGDLSSFLPPQDTSPSLKSSSSKSSIDKTVTNKSSKKKLKTFSWQEKRRIEREQKQREEDEKTLVNMESAIPQSNIGFKMLKQMGYNPGSALGKEGSGLAEPVGLEIRRSRAGIGRLDPHKEKIRREEALFLKKRSSEEALMDEFGSRQKSQWRSRRVVVNFNKAKGALAQLENKEIVEPEKNEDDDEGGEDQEEEEEEEEVITEEDLEEILMKLREEHQYCLFCGCRYESKEALLSNCPGTDEDDH